LFRRLFLSKNLRLPPNSKVCTGDAHSDLVFLQFSRLSDLSLFSSFEQNRLHNLAQREGRTKQADARRESGLKASALASRLAEIGAKP